MTRTAKVELFELRNEWQARTDTDLDEDHVAQLRTVLEDGAQLPPISVVKLDDGSLAVVDGYHRFAAYNSLKSKRVPFEIVAEGQDEIEWQLARANHNHGRHRSSADKRAAVRRALGHARGADASNVEIAKWCAVSVPLVRSVREEERGAPSAAAERQQVLDGERIDAEVTVPYETRRDHSKKPADRKNQRSADEAVDVEPVAFEDLDNPGARASDEPEWKRLAAANEAIVAGVTRLKREIHDALATCLGQDLIVEALNRARGAAKARIAQACPAPHGEEECCICQGHGYVVGDPGNWEAHLAAREGARRSA